MVKEYEQATGMREGMSMRQVGVLSSIACVSTLPALSIDTT
jgi:hypothetical protein